MSFEVRSPFQQFTDQSGAPITNGDVYIGTTNLNPVTNQIAAYWDAAATQPAAQPLSVTGGYIVRNGTPSRIFASADTFSLSVYDKNGALVYNDPAVTSLSPGLKAPLIYQSKASVAALQMSVADAGRTIVINSADGGQFTYRNSGVPGTYTDNGGAYCGTIIVPTGGNGSAAWVRDYSGALDIHWFVPVGTVNDLAAVQAAINSGASAVALTSGTYNLNAGTLTLPANVRLVFLGGKLTNGTVSCTNNDFRGVAGFSETITLTGTILAEEGVLFDWFDCERSTLTQYNTFINGANATYGAAPTITVKNRTILQMLIAAGYAVKFGAGIYPFDAAVAITTQFYLSGVDRESTLLWAPASKFLSYTSGGATYPYMRNLSVESYGNVIYTQANTVNAIHELRLLDSFFMSYSDHAFWNDATIAGGTGCPIYGTHVIRCAVYAGANKGCFTGWMSNSNVYDNVVDLHVFFNGQATNKKGIPLALFYNSNTRNYCNSNISYAGLLYIFYGDLAAGLYYFNARNNTFESNTYSFNAIVKLVSGSSNIYLNVKDNFYIGNCAKENGYAYNLQVGNVYLIAYEGAAAGPIYNTITVRNYSDQFVQVVSTLVDVGATKFRLCYYEPHSSDQATGTNGAQSLLAPSATYAALIGMTNIYNANVATISYIQIARSLYAINGNQLGATASGTTANRPTIGLVPNLMYFDTTLNKPVWYDGSAWRDATGALV